MAGEADVLVKTLWPAGDSKHGNGSVLFSYILVDNVCVTLVRERRPGACQLNGMNGMNM